MKVSLRGTVILLVLLTGTLVTWRPWRGEDARQGTRFGALPIRRVNPWFRTSFPDPEDLEPYCFGRNPWFRWPRLLYTRRGGFLDVDHVRNAMDATFHLHRRLRAAQTGQVAYDPEGPFCYKVPAASGWALEIAAWLAFQQSVDQEVATWYDYRTCPGISERPSAFSFEDVYSDLLGVVVATEVLRMDPEADEDAYSRSAEVRFKTWLTTLQAVGGAEALRASEVVRNRWWSDAVPWPDNRKILRRNLDIGLGDDTVSPWLVDGSAEPCLLQVPSAPGDAEAWPKFQTEAWSLLCRDLGFPVKGPLKLPRDRFILMARLERDIRAELGRKAVEP